MTEVLISCAATIADLYGCFHNYKNVGFSPDPAQFISDNITEFSLTPNLDYFTPFFKF